MSEETPAEVQARGGPGAPDVQWRLDRELVAERFARSFLGWNQVSVADEGVLDGDGPRLVSLTPCDQPEACRPVGILFLSLVQPAGEGPAVSGASLRS